MAVTNPSRTRKVENAKQVPIHEGENVLMIGGVGSGKSTQFRTLPGRKFAYVFDPNAVRSYEGSDIDYVAFVPDIDDLDLSVKSLKRSGEVMIGDKPHKKREPRTYVEWEADFEERLENGFFNQYDWVGWDSMTTFQEIVMDRVLHINGRLGKHPEQGDYTAQMEAVKNVFRVLTNLNCNVYCTAHVEVSRDELTGRVTGRIIMTGRLRFRIPMLFSQIFACDVETTNAGKTTYTIQTRPDKENPVVRTTMQDLELYHDVTLDMKRDLVGQGLGGLLLKHGLKTKSPAKTSGA